MSTQAPELVLRLIERFDLHSEAYRSQSYNETQVRREFIDPLFKALGWDVDNEKGYAEQWKEVVHEDAIKIGGVTKAPDYSFRLGGRRLFFLEAKKPAINLKEDPGPAYQLRRYAWTAKMPLSILTDFEEFIVYDTRVKPAPTDKANAARMLYRKYTDYAECWEEIEGIFSPAAIKRGAFDKYVDSSAKKRGTAEVDDAFLAEIETWREALARNLALRNPGLTQRELNFAVQRTIDRIVFLRICEDRGVEDYGRLQALLNGVNVYPRLRVLFERADERYNSGLFHFHPEKDRAGAPDELTLRLEIDDKVLKTIFKRLYYPESPYEFAVMPAEILGQVYERFLGSVIRLTASHQAKVEQKPEVRKAGGVYYTPAYIVDYIVKHTVGELLKEAKPGPRGSASKLRILDPACGSGSFLLGAYRYLLDWHLEKYLEDPGAWSKGKSPAIFQGRRGEWKLTTAERKRILLNNIYGVDIDPQAVEVTKLSLLLKVLEDENAETLNRQLTLFHERALPDLGENVKCGNSLIGPDFYDNRQLDLFDDEERYRINAFDWKREFPDIMKSGGFDAVIGNPPYVRQEGLGEQKEHFQAKYEAYHGMGDLYVYFIEKGVKLLKENGRFSYIVANKWMRANYGQPLRAWLKKQCIEEIIDFGDLPVFKSATTYPCIMVITNQNAKKKFRAAEIKTLAFTDLTEYVEENRFDIEVASLDESGWALTNAATQKLLQKLREQGKPLGEYIGGKIYYGIKTGLNNAFVIDTEKREEIIRKDPKSKELIKPFLVGRDIKRYQITDCGRYLILIPTGWTTKNSGNSQSKWNWFKKNYPAIAEHLEPFEEKAKARYDKGEYWWELRTCDYYDVFEKCKIMWPEIANGARFAFDDGSFFTNNKVFNFPSNDMYLLGVLNSRVLRLFIHSVCTDLQGGSYNFSGVFLEKVPIRPIDFNNKKDKARHDEMVSLVERMLTLHAKLGEGKEEHARTIVQREIAALDARIDRLVYELYGLSEEEIGIVEG